MKSKIVKILIACVTVLIIVGCTTTVTSEALTTTEAINNQDVRYNERNIQNLASQIFYVDSENDLNTLYEALKNRNGKIIIEVSNGIMTDEHGNGIDNCGYYRHYDSERFSVGDRVQSVFIYNPENNAVDDILYRIDTVAQ